MGILRFISGQGNMSVDSEIGLVSRYALIGVVKCLRWMLMG
jgi:hypothetical protein